MVKAGISLKGTQVETLKKTRVSTQPGARRRKTFDDKRQFILNTALSVFSQFGFHGTTMEQIASSADISKTNLSRCAKPSFVKANLPSLSPI